MINEKIAFKNHNYKKVMALSSGSLLNAVALIRLGYFRDAEALLLKYKPKSESKNEELLLNIQMIELYKKLLDKNNNFEQINNKLLNMNIKRKDIYYGNIALSCLGSNDSIELLNDCVNSFGSKFSNFSYKNDLGFVTGNIDLIDEVLKESYVEQDIYMLTHANMYKGFISKDKKLLIRSINILDKLKCLPDLQLLKNRINKL